MAESNSGGQERTEQPTPRRVQRAREEGKVARSQELAGAVALLASALALGGWGAEGVVRYAGELMRECAHLPHSHIGMTGATEMISKIAGGLVYALLPFFLFVGGGVLAVNLVQARGVFTFATIMPKWSHVDPMAGVKRIVNVQSLFTLGKSLAKMVILGLVAFAVIRGCWPEITSLAEGEAVQVGAVVRTVILRLAFWIGLLFLGISLIDYAYQVHQHQKSLRMTRQEVVYESRETDGDPHIKAHIRAMGRAMARRRMLQKVPEADVVVVNPTSIAVALRYDISVAPAPVVVAMGQRKLAEKIRSIAHRASVPIVENRLVARALLATSKIGKPIPPALYAAVAEVLAFVYRMRNKSGTSHSGSLRARSGS